MPEERDFIAIFKAESEEHLTNLDKGLVELEKNPDNIELVNKLNREAHTLKGSARVFGFHEIQEIAHRIEDIFDKVGQKKLKFNSFITDRVFKALDAIRIILERIVKEEKIGVDVTDVAKELEECLSGEEEKTEKRIKEEKEDFKAQERPEAEKKKKKAKKPGARKQPPKATKDIKKKSTKTVEKTATSAVAMEEYIRVPLSRVNKLLNLVGEIVINKMKSSGKIIRARRLSRFTKELQKRFSDLSERVKKEFSEGDERIIKLLDQCNADIQRLRENSLNLYDSISTETFHLDPVIDELQNRMKEIRMLPLATIFEGFPRMVRDIASEKNKEVNLEVSGEEIELDKKVLEGIKAPLIHILRNSIDHGIEKPDKRVSFGKPRYGMVKVTAFHEAGNVIITIEDDGRGIDLDDVKQTAVKKRLITTEELEGMTEKEIFNLIFMNGYSTSPIITDVSGRGIGLDVVRKDIESLKGQVNLDTDKGKGTKLTLVLPLTIAIVKVLLVKVKTLLFALPMTSIAESLQVNMKEVFTIEGKMAIQVRDRTVPAVKLEEILELPPEYSEEEKQSKEELSVVIATSLEKRVGFIVDEIIGEGDVFIKALGEHLGKIKNVSGATILGTGEIVVILDVAGLIANSALSHPALTVRKTVSQEQKQKKRILIVEDALSTREFEKSILETQGYLIDTAVDGLDALDKITQVKYDLFIVDIQMPRMDGFEFCETLNKNEEYRDIPVVIVTALEKEEDKRRGIEVGAQAYIVKTSFDQAKLLDTIERLIG